MTDIETIQHEDGRVGDRNGEHTGKQDDGESLKCGTCENI